MRSEYDRAPVGPPGAVILPDALATPDPPPRPVGPSAITPIVMNERHLQPVLTEFIGYYNHERPHRTLDLQMPVPRSASRAGEVVSRPILGGLHHAYA